jgi:hypothetical protein
VKGYRACVARDHPLAPPSGVMQVCRIVLYDKIGPGSHPCHWCGQPVQWRVIKKGGRLPDELMVDHLDWDKQNDDPANLVPSCNHCNHTRTREHDRRRIEANETVISRSDGYRTRAVERECEHCGAPFLALPANIRKGHGRYCSRACDAARRRKHPVR